MELVKKYTGVIYSVKNFPEIGFGAFFITCDRLSFMTFFAPA
jgi:hypothetical protein